MRGIDADCVDGAQQESDVDILNVVIAASDQALPGSVLTTTEWGTDLQCRNLRKRTEDY